MSELLAKYRNIRLSETYLVSDFIIKILCVPSVVLFYGDLGSGKTNLCSDIIKSLIKDEANTNNGFLEITSPTFNILYTYQINNGFFVNHYDLYRIESMQELLELGFLDSLINNLTLIEWPKFLHDFFRENKGIVNVLEVYIDYGENSRDFLIKRLS